MPWIWIEPDEDLKKMLAKIDAKLTTLSKQMEAEMTAMEDAVAALGTQVDANTNAEASAVALIKNLADLITANAGNPQAVNELANKLKASAEALGAAVVANTPTNT